MKAIRICRLGILAILATLVLGASDSGPALAVSGADSGLPTIEVSAGLHVLKYHTQSQSQYQDLPSGSHPLSNGTYFQTVGGEATILFPDNSAIILDAGTEVRVVLDGNSTYIVQKSGTVAHSVEWRPGVNYCVDMPFGLVVATGTEFFTFIDTPFEGAVSVVAGSVVWQPFSGTVDPRSGEAIWDYWKIYHWTKQFVPDNMPIAVYPHDQSLGQALKWGDYFRLSVDALRSPTTVTGKKIVRPSGSAWVQRNQHLLQMINALRRALPIKHLTPDEYRQKLRDILGIDSEGFNPDVPVAFSGGYWIGARGNPGKGPIIKFCMENNMLDSINYYGLYGCVDHQTGEEFNHWVGISLGPMVFFPVGPGGRINTEYKIPDGVYKDVFFYLRGTMGSSTGRVWVVIYADNDVVFCLGNSGPINVRRIDTPCPR